MAKPQIKHYGKVINGKMRFHNEPLWEQQRLALEGKEFELVIKEKHKKPTNDQYSYYFGGILGTCHESEMFSHFDKPQDIHDDYFSPKFLSYSKMVVMKNERYQIKQYHRLSELTRKELGEFIDKVIAWCETEGIHILTSEQYYTNQFNTEYK